MPQKDKVQEQKPFPWKRLFFTTIFLLFFAICAIILLLSTGHIIDYSWYYITPVLTATVSAMVTVLQWLTPLSPLEFKGKTHILQTQPTLAERVPTITTTSDSGGAQPLPAYQSPNQQLNREPAPETSSPSNNAVFLVNMPLTDPNEFYGRILERSKLLSRTRNGGCTSIIGPRRIGKTWLMSYLLLTAPIQLGMNFHIGSIDATLPSCGTVSGFTTEALKALGYPLSSAPEHPDLALLEDFVKGMVSKKRTPILLIDEFEGFSHRPDFNLSFFAGLRAITTIGLVLVVASQDSLIDIVSENVKTSPFFNVFLQLKLGPFDAKDIEEFTQAKSIQAGFTEQERTYLLKYGRINGQQPSPLCLQLVGEMLLEDKRLAAIEGSHYYRPTDPKYWSKFVKRGEEAYQGIVKL